jgi:phosphatidylglycerophosphatase C
VTVPSLSVDQLLARLDELAEKSGQTALTFDGDGTLWSGDVAEDVFQFAIEHNLIGQDAAEALARSAQEHGLPSDGSPTELAKRLFVAYLEGAYPERTVCEMMTWCFAGWTLADLSAITRRALNETRLDERVHRELEPVFAWSRARHGRIVIVSASPRFIVEQAARRWDVSPSDIAASTPVLESGRVQPALAGPVPYAEAKVSHARELLGAPGWLAAFGDSAFDVELMRAAALGVAVRPKPALLAALADLDQGVVLEI